MDNPFHKLKDEIEEIKRAVERRVKIAICRETLAWNLSRLMTLDPDNAALYQRLHDELEAGREDKTQ